MKERDSKSLYSVEQILEELLKQLISDSIGQYPTNVSCAFVNNSNLAILIENVRTPLEDFLSRYCSPEMLKKYRDGLDHALGKRVYRLVETTIDCPVEQVSMSHQTDTRWMVIYVLQ